jgi:hypothetical protein
VFVTFRELTAELVLWADLVAAIDPRDPERELYLYPPHRGAGAPSPRALLVVLDAHRRDEQVRDLRGRLAELHPATGSDLRGPAT